MSMHENFDFEPVYDEFYRLCAGKTTRAKFLKRAGQLGLSAAAIGAFVKAYNPATARADIEAADAAARAGASGATKLGFYQWILNFNPQIQPLTNEYNKKFPDAQVQIQVAPESNFSTQKFLLEARNKTSSWDVYVGMTPFVEMSQLQAAGAIAPWDPYMPASVKNDMPKSVQDEGMIDGKMYDWPILLDISSLQWRKSMFKEAGVRAIPATWEEFTATAKQINGKHLKSGSFTVAGATFDWHPWRSLMPVVHSISLDVYDKDRNPDFTNPTYVQAIKICKGIIPYTPPDFFASGTAVEAATIDDVALKASRVAMIFKYPNAIVHDALLWPKSVGAINDMGLAKLPKPAAGGAGGSVFWNTGAGLFQYGRNKQAGANWLTWLLSDPRFWTQEVISSGQISPFKSMYPKLKGKAPDWVFTAYSQLAASKAIENSIYGFSLGLNGALVTNFTDALKGKISPEQAMQKTASEFKKQLQQQMGG
jgi:multiple sugar transport system substrate-binding protein